MSDDFHDSAACGELLHLLPWFMIFGAFFATMMTFTAYMVASWGCAKLA